MEIDLIEDWFDWRLIFFIKSETCQYRILFQNTKNITFIFKGVRSLVTSLNDLSGSSDFSELSENKNELLNKPTTLNERVKFERTRFSFAGGV